MRTRLTALHSLFSDTEVIVCAGTNDFTEATVPVFNPYLDIPQLEIFETKDLVEFEDYQTFPCVQGEKDITCAATAFRDIPLVIPLCSIRRVKTAIG